MHFCAWWWVTLHVQGSDQCDKNIPCYKHWSQLWLISLSDLRAIWGSPHQVAVDISHVPQQKCLPTAVGTISKLWPQSHSQLHKLNATSCRHCNCLRRRNALYVGDLASLSSLIPHASPLRMHWKTFRRSRQWELEYRPWNIIAVDV